MKVMLRFGQRMIVAASLASACAFAAAAQKEFSAPPERTLDAYRKLSGIADAAWKVGTPESVAAIEAKQAKLPAKLELGMRTVLAAAPDKPVVATITKTLKPLAGGYVLVDGQGGLERGETHTTELNWAGLLTIHGYTEETFHVSGVLAGPGERKMLRKLSAVKTFDLDPAQMKPGYRFTEEVTTSIASRSKLGLASRENKLDVNAKLDCAVNPGGAAADLASGLSGEYLRIHCTAEPAGLSEWVYLSDYAFFMPTRVKTKVSESEYKLLSTSAGPPR